MKKELQAKLKNKSGFTLIELLIVVAIIAILIAVSIPLIASAMDKAKISTDAANERAAKAEMVISATDKGEGMNMFNPGKIYAFDAAAGSLVDAKANSGDVAKISPYGQYGQGTATNTSGKILYVIQDASGTIYYLWDIPEGKDTAALAQSDLWTKGSGPLMQKADNKNEADTVKQNLNDWGVVLAADGTNQPDAGGGTPSA